MAITGQDLDLNGTGLKKSAIYNSGLRCFLNRFSHVVINVADLQRAMVFYEVTTPLRVVATIHAEKQPMPGLGFETGSFEGYVMRDDNEGHPCEVHLIKWNDPEPVGEVYPDFNSLGYFRLCFKSTDVLQRYEDALEAGGHPFTEPLLPRPGYPYGRPVFSFRDPDGTVIEYVTMPGLERLYHVNFNVEDVEETRRYMEEVIGLTCFLTLENDTPERNSFSKNSGPSTCKGALFKVGGGDASRVQPMFSLDVVQWTQPVPAGEPYKSQNHLGIVRSALEVHHLDETYDILRRTPGITLSGPPVVINLGSDLGEQRHLSFTTPDDMTFELVEQPDYPLAK